MTNRQVDAWYAELEATKDNTTAHLSRSLRPRSAEANGAMSTAARLQPPLALTLVRNQPGRRPRWTAQRCPPPCRL